MNKIYLLYFNFLMAVCSFGQVGSLRSLSSKAFIKAYDGTKEHREALRSIESQLYDFTGSLIENKDFSGENFEGSDFQYCRLIDVNLNKTNLTGANFAGATFKDVSVDGVILQPGWVIKGSMSDLQIVHLYSDLANAEEEYDAEGQKEVAEKCRQLLNSLNQIVFKARKLNLKGADLSDINLTGINLSNSNLEKANLSFSDLTGANLERSNLINADLRNIKGFPNIHEVILAPGEIFEYDATISHLIAIYKDTTNPGAKKVLKQLVFADIRRQGFHFPFDGLDPLNICDFFMAIHLTELYGIEVNLSHSFMGNFIEANKVFRENISRFDAHNGKLILDFLSEILNRLKRNNH